MAGGLSPATESSVAPLIVEQIAPRTMTDDELRLARQCLNDNQGRLTEAWLCSIGYSQRARPGRSALSGLRTSGWSPMMLTLGKPSVLAVPVRSWLQIALIEQSCSATHDTAR